MTTPIEQLTAIDIAFSAEPLASNFRGDYNWKDTDHFQEWFAISSKLRKNERIDPQSLEIQIEAVKLMIDAKQFILDELKMQLKVYLNQGYGSLAKQ